MFKLVGRHPWPTLTPGPNKPLDHPLPEVAVAMGEPL